MKSARLLLLAWLPLAAQAHSPIKGVMPFYGGVMHPFIVPAHVMAMIAMGLFIGRQAQDRYGPMLLCLLGPMVIGVSLSGLAGNPDTDMPLLLTTAVIAVAVAWARPGPAPLSMALIGTAALLLGLGSAPDGINGTARWLHLAGCCLGLQVGTGAMLVLAEHARRPWQQIGVRVVCSWVAASSLLVLALTALGPRKPTQRLEGKPAAWSSSQRQGPAPDAEGDVATSKGCFCGGVIVA